MKQLFALLMILGLSVLSFSSYATEPGAEPECAEGDEQCLQQKQRKEKQKQAPQEEEPECE